MRGLVALVFATIVLVSSTAGAQVYDHLKCYKIKDSAKFRATADLDALDPAFPDDSCSIKGKGKYFCVPTASDVLTFEDRSRDGIPQVPLAGEGLSDAKICYKIKCTENNPADRTATDPFGTRGLSKFKLKLLCAPAIDGVPPTTTTTTLPPAPKRVFVTNAAHTGGLGGLTGADAVCQSAATAAGLGGTWMAWLSDTTQGPATRFTTQSALGYETVSGTTIANDWSDLVDGILAAAPDEDEYGTSLGDVPVWTNTGADGNPYCTTGTTSCDCNGWTDSSGLYGGWYGHSGAGSRTWTWYSAAPCRTVGFHLYCFEQ
jgi:hypothetical protein